VQDVELVNVALRGLPRSWEPFVQGICARDKLPDFDRLWTDCIQEETWLVSKDDLDGPVKSSSDENQALAARTRKGRRGSPDRRGPPGRRASPEREASPKPRRKKDLSRIRCFECHEFGHYASQCPLRRGRGRRQQASTAEVDEVADRFQREILLVSSLSGIVSSRERWLVDSGASCHMTGARELFDTLTETGPDLCVELGTRAKHSVRGSGTVSFRLDSGETLRVSNVLWVPELRRSVLSVSEIERKGYHVMFRYGQVLLVPRRTSFRSTMVLGVREGNLYRLRGQPMGAMASRGRETEEEEQVVPPEVRQMAPPVAQVQREPEFRGRRPSGSRREEQPPRTMQRTVDREQTAPEVVQTQRESGFRWSMRSQSEPSLRESQLAQRERWSSRGSSPSGSDGRETSSRTGRQVSWVEEVRQEMQEQEASESCVPSMEGPVDSTGYATVIEEARQEPQRQEASRACGTCMEDPCVLAGIASVTEGVAREAA
jgi:hypothetical protein